MNFISFGQKRTGMISTGRRPDVAQTNWTGRAGPGRAGLCSHGAPTRTRYSRGARSGSTAIPLRRAAAAPLAPRPLRRRSYAPPPIPCDASSHIPPISVPESACSSPSRHPFRSVPFAASVLLLSRLRCVYLCGRHAEKLHLTCAITASGLVFDEFLRFPVRSRSQC